jgi:hypothetical protein
MRQLWRQRNAGGRWQYTDVRLLIDTNLLD